MENWAAELNGKIIGGYRIGEELGRGSNAVVFAAEQLSMARPVALKILLPELAENNYFADQFLNEARIAGRLDHENIIRTFDTGADAEYCYIAMELVRGVSVESMLGGRGKALPPELVLQIGRSVADALSYAWREFGMSHGDIKPGNILITSDTGAVKLADFGLARIAGRENPGGKVMATPMYAAPEIIRRDREVNLQKCDLYSFGVMLYELCSGIPPFRGSVKEILDAHLHAVPVPLRELVPEIPDDLAALIAELMQKDPQKRPESWDTVHARLLLPFSGDWGKADPVPEEEPEPENPVKHSSRLIVSLAGILILGIGLGFLFYFLLTAKRQEPAAAELLAEIRKPLPAEAGPQSISEPEKTEEKAEEKPAPVIPAPLPEKLPEAAKENPPAEKEIPAPPVKPAPLPKVQKKPQKQRPVLPVKAPAKTPDKVPEKTPAKPPAEKEIKGFEFYPELKRAARQIQALPDNYAPASPAWKKQAVTQMVRCYLFMRQAKLMSGVPVLELRGIQVVKTGGFSGKKGIIKIGPSTSPKMLAYPVFQAWYDNLRGMPSRHRDTVAAIATGFAGGELPKNKNNANVQKALKKLHNSPIVFFRSLRNGKLKRMLK